MSHAGARPHQAVNKAVEVDQQDKALQLLGEGKTYAEIATELGIGVATAHRRVQVACERLISPQVETYRKMQDVDLDYARDQAMKILRTADDPDVRLRAIDRLVRVNERRAKLHGLDAPEKVDATVHAVTQQDLELAELLREEAAKEAAKGERVDTGD